MRKIVFLNFIIALFFIYKISAYAGVPTAQPQPQPQESHKTTAVDPQFAQKLDVMLSRTESSIQLLREQIVRNQSAPFLANLYLQLGDLLSERSTVLYYLQMDHDQKTDQQTLVTQKFSPVVAAEREAIAVYQQIIKEFQTFDKLSLVIYRLAVAQKSIGESQGFAESCEKLIKMFPESKEALQARLLLGQYYYDQQNLTSAKTYLAVIKDAKYPYERNAARYRLGLIDIAEGHLADALKKFELVVTDTELKEEDNPLEVSLKTKTIKSNLKREALIDSVRAYTEVYRDHPQPVEYYSQMAPTEVLFQEAIEKLAYRYVFLKQYTEAIKLLRTLSERTADPQRVVNIYHDVLQTIPIAERTDVPVSEMQFVLEAYNEWSSHTLLKAEVRKSAHDFFETQIRELGTRSHDLAKTETQSTKKALLFERARGFYLLYLGFFEKDPRTVKVAVNLADVAFNQGRYLDSGNYYLRTYAGDFGPLPSSISKTTLIQNAILALQKPFSASYYEQLRAQGLLVKAIQTYQSFDRRQKNDPGLNFTLAKTYYEQGYYERALRDLWQFIKRYPKSSQASAAADLIIYYYNLRSDFKGLAEVTNKMLALPLGSDDLRQHLKDVHSKSLLRRLDDTVKAQKGFDRFSASKSYLQTALHINDTSLRSAAFQQALARSKSEQDVNTFITAAAAMAKSEANVDRRAETVLSLADETLALTRYYQTLQEWNAIAVDVHVSLSTRQKTFDKILKLLLMLRDLPQLANAIKNPLFQSVSEDTKKNLQKQLVGMLDSGLVLPADLYALMIHQAVDDEDWLALWKAQFNLQENERKVVVKNVSEKCRATLNSALCKWNNWSTTAVRVAEFQSAVAKTTPQLKSVEVTATMMNGVLNELKVLDGTGDSSLDILLNLAAAEIYRTFAQFLEKTAAATPDVAQLLKSKASESFDAAENSRKTAQKIVSTSGVLSPVTPWVERKSLPTLTQVLRWPQEIHLHPPASDPHNSSIDDMQKKLFIDHSDQKSFFALGALYLKLRQWHHATAVAVYGQSTFPSNAEDYSALLGCAVLQLGFVNEAKFYLNKASSLEGHKERCLMELQRKQLEVTATGHSS